MHLKSIGLTKPILFALIAWCFLGTALRAQSLAEEIRFSKYLVANKLHQDNILLLKRALGQYTPNEQLADSINFSLAVSYFNINADSSFTYFTKVGSGSTDLFNKSQFLMAYFYCQQDSLIQAAEVLNQLNVANDDMACIKWLGSTGVSLMQNAADGAWMGYADSLPPMCASQTDYPNLLSYNLEAIKPYKKKSPWVAGALSAIVPGLGRVYAGKPKQGLLSFLPFIFMGLQTYEGYRKGGWDDPRFIVYGSVMSIFYVGNIWGSALSVNIKQKEVYDEVHYQVMATFKVPVSVLLGTGR